MNTGKHLQTIDIQGPFVRIYHGKKLFKKRVVGGKFVRQWYLMKENKFDPEIYEDMDNDDKLFFIECYGIYSKNEGTQKSTFENFRVRLAEPFVSKLKLLEGEILAGNMNQRLLDDYYAILKDLVYHNFMTARQATTLKKRLKLTHSILEQSVDISNQISKGPQENAKRD